MDMRMKSSALLAALLLGAIIISGGCTKKTGIERSAKTTSTMQNVESNIQHAAMQIDATNTSLENLVKFGETVDLKKSFDMFSENVSEMENVSKTLLAQINDMNSQGNEYFEEWRKEGQTYINPEIQKLSEERRIQLRRSFNDIADASTGMRGALNQYVSEVKEIQTYLSANLSNEAIKAVSPIAERTMSDGNSLKGQLKPVQVAIDQARSAMIPGGAAAGGTVPSGGTAPSGETTPDAGGAGAGEPGFDQQQ